MDNTNLMSKQNVLKFTFESVLIVASVFLALFLDDYRNDLEQDKIKYRALMTVQSELNDNLKIVTAWRSNHNSILENLEKALQDKSFQDRLLGENIYVNIFDNIMPRGITSSGTVDDSAWQALKVSNVFSNLNIDTALILSKVYRNQNAGIESTLNRINEVLNSSEILLDKNIEVTLLRLRNIFHELVAQEIFIIQRYRFALEEIEIAET